MLNLSERLSIIAGKIQAGKSVCDVGTDHGYLPAYLYLSGKYKKVTATDIRQKPLENAKSNCKRFNANGVDLVLCDGLSGVKREDADTVIIAGMGGEVISKIITDCTFLPDRDINLILQPMTAIHKLRRFLNENGYLITEETPVKEKGKIYSIICAKYDGIKRGFDEFSLLVGALKFDNALSKEYLEKQIRIYSKRVQLLDGSCNKGAQNSSNEVLCKLNKLLEENYGA